jgi:hypothetical protein
MPDPSFNCGEMTSSFRLWSRRFLRPAQATDAGAALDRRRKHGWHWPLCSGRSSVPQLSLHTPVGDIAVFAQDGATVLLDRCRVAGRFAAFVPHRTRDPFQPYSVRQPIVHEWPPAPAGGACCHGFERGDSLPTGANQSLNNSNEALL